MEISTGLFNALASQATDITNSYTKTSLEDHLNVRKRGSTSQITQLLQACLMSKKTQITLQAFVFCWFAQRYHTSKCSSVADFAAQYSALRWEMRGVLEAGNRIMLLESLLRGSGMFVIHAKSKLNKLRFKYNDANHFIGLLKDDAQCRGALESLASFQKVYGDFRTWTAGDLPDLAGAQGPEYNPFEASGGLNDAIQQEASFLTSPPHQTHLLPS